MNLLEEKWKKTLVSCNEISFADFAFNELQSFTFHQDFKLMDVISEILNLEEYPEQFNPLSNFGEPPLTLFLSKLNKFILEIYIWNESHTSVHDHSFEGAFTILQGQSIEIEYDFKVEKNLGISQLGVLEKKNFFHLTPGQVRKIKRGNQFIHKVIHISKPTVSLVLRTYNDVNDMKQLDYHFNNLASPSSPDKGISGKLRVFNWYLENNMPVSQKMIDTLLPYSRFWKILATNPQTKNLVTKLAKVLNRISIIKSMNDENIVARMLKVLERDEDKIYLSLLEYFEPQSFDYFIINLEQLNLINLPKLNLESFKTTLIEKINSESIIIKGSFLEHIISD